MKNYLTRRDFLKLVGLLPLSLVVPPSLNSFAHQQPQKNVLIVVLDALSASHISLFGYQRETMPNLSRLAERGIVYHKHYSNGNFTTPGTASLLTGVHPWAHRAFGNLGIVDASFIDKSIFRAFQNYHRITYTHNPWASALLEQFISDVETYIPTGELLLTDDYFIPLLFNNDEDIARVSWIRTAKKIEEGYAYSLFFSRFYESLRNFRVANMHSQYPRGIPNIYKDNYFLLEYAVDWLANELRKLNQPFLGYFHFWPPHDPFTTHREFIDRFKNDDLKYVPKARSIFSKNEESVEEFNQYRIEYDEFILYADREFGRLMDHLEKFGLLANTYVVLTSDHGEMLDRGIAGHSTPVLYEPLIHVPLVIFEPGRNKREDVHLPTSSIDLLPTLLNATGQQQANWTEGVVLPPFNDEYSSDSRAIYVLEAAKNEKYQPLTIATVAMIKDNYKLVYFFGYDELGGTNSEMVELYDIRNDPGEFNNLFLTKKTIGEDLLNELHKKLMDVNAPYL